ncbi:carcinoembryonic antigen-related cell adhesion molecule 6-like [Clupea harengus]|uniref:Carcinoembryonic antigen-related cell adhesion molecule 6-like n=1 Tax=Clupea harengus TaxID=7950 RepID=A0A6P8GB46_CLUHA|nr:carcinoembryonic antigen-related cell adhesion molecule 6-like [Clupea harengus]
MDLLISSTVLFLSAAGFCSCQNELRLNGPLNGAVGGSVKFTLINPPSAPPQRITWSFRGNRDITIFTSIGGGEDIHADYVGRISVNKTTASLELRGLTHNDNGLYTVTISIISGGVQQQGNTLLTVFENISNATITITGGILIAGESSVNLTCDAQGSIITREWTKDGKPLSPSNSITFFEENRTLSISPVEKDDGGEYMCHISSPFSTMIASQTVTVNYGPDTVIIVGVEVDCGHFINLTCTAESVPESTYTWAFNGTETSVTGASYVKELSEYEDSGKYTCTALNSITKLSGKADFDVSVTDKRKENSLSAGAIAGIGVACLILGVAVGVGGSFFAMKKLPIDQKGLHSGNSRRKNEVPGDRSVSKPASRYDAPIPLNATTIANPGLYEAPTDGTEHSGSVHSDDTVYETRISVKRPPVVPESLYYKNIFQM